MPELFRVDTPGEVCHRIAAQDVHPLMFVKEEHRRDIWSSNSPAHLNQSHKAQRTSVIIGCLDQSHMQRVLRYLRNGLDADSKSRLVPGVSQPASAVAI